MLMGAGTSLETLKSQKAKVKVGMSSDKDAISSAEDEIERLQKASDSLKSSIEKIEEKKESIEELEINKNKWKGEVEETFSNKQETYQTGVGSYVRTTKNVKDKVDEALEEEKQKKIHAENSLENMERVLSDLELEIAAKEDWLICRKK